MTEEEAKKKWCPMVRYDSDGGTFNRGYVNGWLNDHPHNLNALCNCIASDCMMWVIGDYLSTGGYCGLVHKVRT